MVTVGVIGAGHWGKKHVEEFRALEAETYVADLDQKNLEICRERYGAHPCSLKDMLSDNSVSGVTICTPIGTHYEISKAALRAEKHALVEKPLATTVRQADYLVRLARQKRLLLAVGHIYRFNNAINRIRQLLREDYFGHIRVVRFAWTNLEPLYADRDVISDLAPHPFDILNFLFDRDPTEFSCIGNAYRQRDLTEAAFINCVLGRILVNIELSWLTPWKQRVMSLTGSEASARVDCLSQKIDVFRDGNVVPIQVAANNTIRDELQHFLSCIEKGERSIADAESAISAIRAVQVTQRALREKRTLRF